jgi:hypothetical protein
MSIATTLAGAKAKIALALAALLALAVALWEAYTKGKQKAEQATKDAESKDLREVINVTGDVNSMIQARPPNISVIDIKPEASRLGERTATPENLPGAVRLDQANPDSSAGRLNILVQARK